MHYHLPLIGVKSRIQSGTYETEETKNYVVELVAEKVTFLSSKKNDKADE